MSRLLSALAFCALALSAAPAAAQSDVSREMIVGDPAAPVAGDPKGDVTIVAYLDYNCGFCKKSAPALDRLVKSDGKIRLVYKEWPILSETSVVGAKLALAAKYQGKYREAHQALMGIVGAKIPTEKMTAALTSAGIDMARLKADAATHNAEITAAIKRNDAQARGMGFRGTPVYLVGPLLVAAPLDDAGFKEAVSQARKRQKGG